MKKLLLLYSLIIVQLYSFSQTDIQWDTRVSPVLKQAVAKSGYFVYSRNTSSRLINIGVLNQSSHTMCWFTCHGRLFDSTQLTDGEYEQVISKQVDPFVLYQHICNEYLVDISVAKDIFRLNGDNKLVDTLNPNYHALFASESVRKAETPLQKLIAIDNVRKYILTQLAYLNCVDPFGLQDNPLFKTNKEQAGTMIQTKDSTVYYNIDPTSAVTKINLYKNSPEKLYIYNRLSVLIDSVPVLAEKYNLLLKEKTDVFLLYRGWLELQWQGVMSNIMRSAKSDDINNAGLYSRVNIKDENATEKELYSQLNAIETKINVLISPEAKCIEQAIYDTYKNETSEMSYIPLLGIGYDLIQKRGQKEYELTNHLGNVLATVSDKKPGHSSNDSIVDYYTPDVVSARDYYPFGMLQPGRSYLSPTEGNKYRYGFNGKENDNEVKGEGNQQDYGMRVYDPRLGKFLSVDPLTKSYPFMTPYAFAENDVIRSIDLDGLEKYIVYRQIDNNNDLVSIAISSFLDKDGKVRDNEIYKYNPKFKKANVYVMTFNVNTGNQIGPIRYQNSLTRDQQIVDRQFGTRASVSSKLSKDEESRFFEINTNKEGKGIGNKWEDGDEKDAVLNLRLTANIAFQQNSNAPINNQQANLLAPAARVLRLFPNTRVDLIGNGGVNVGNPGNVPLGNGPAAMNAPAILNGQNVATRTLLQARAAAAGTLLQRVYSINPSRINQPQAGAVFGNPSGRNVQVRVTGTNL